MKTMFMLVCFLLGLLVIALLSVCGKGLCVK